jgi:hypothetical protein
MAASDTSAAVPQFYPAATAVLIGLLVTWLVAEARDVRDTRSKQPRDGASQTPARLAGLRDATWIVTTGLLLASGALAALHVQYKGRASTWEQGLIWSTLVLGFASLIFSAVVTMLPERESSARTFTLTVRGVRRAFPLAAALAAGFIASPLLGEDVRVQRGGTYVVYGTCLNGGCGLKQRTGPGPSFPAVAKRLLDGTRVFVVCQAHGPPAPGFATRVWDRLENGLFVSDAFVATQDRRGGFSSDHLPRCPPDSRDNGARG